MGLLELYGEIAAADARSMPNLSGAIRKFAATMHPTRELSRSAHGAS
jgi:hypothetical protein